MSQLMPPSLVTRVGPGGQGNMKVPDRGGLALRRSVEDRVPQSRFGCRTVPQKKGSMDTSPSQGWHLAFRSPELARLRDGNK